MDVADHSSRSYRFHEGRQVTLSIIAVCVLFYLLNNVLRNPQGGGAIAAEALPLFAFSPGQWPLWPGILTHIFSHSDFAHIFANLLTLYIVGTSIERAYGSVVYALIYFASGLVAALVQILVMPDVVLLGASGAVAGIMACFVRHWPLTVFLIYGIIPLPSWLFMALWMLFNIAGALGIIPLPYAFVAHIAGFLAGLGLSKLLVPYLVRW